MPEKLKQLILKLNEQGIPLPMIRDPKTRESSVSLTMMFISFNVVLIGIIGKFSKKLDIDLQQALYWFGMTAALYFGRKMSGNSSTKVIELENEDK